MIKLNVEIANDTITTDCEVNGSNREIIAELASIIDGVIYRISDSPEEFAAYAVCLAELLNNTDYEVVKEAFSNGLQ